MNLPVQTKLATAIQRATLRPYQSEIKSEIYQAWNAGAVNVLAVLPTGAGKTVTFSDIIHDHQGASCAIAHRQELVSQISLALARDRVRHRIIGPKNVVKLCVNIHMAEVGASYYDPSAPCAVAGVDTLVRRGDELANWLQSVTLCVQDECFPAGTLVDETPIEEIQVGDYVTAYNETTGLFEKRRVERLYKNKTPDRLLKVVTRSHHVLNCTAGHPFLTKRGWVEAIELKSDDEVLINEVRYMPEPGKSETCDDELLPSGGPGLLQCGMFEHSQGEALVGDNERYEQEIRLGTNEEKQPHESRSVPFKNEQDATGDRSRTKGSWGQRSTSDGIRKETFRNVRNQRFQSADKSFNGQNGRVDGLPETLQNRLRKPYVKNSNRSGRAEPPVAEKTGTGREKRQVSYWCRLDSVTVLECGNTECPGQSSFDGFVYNIEVEGLHNYIAEGVVVHNCHHVLESNKWGTAFKMFPNARGLGVTATPLRADGKGLGRHADGLFDVMVEGPGMRDLISMGYLTDYRVFAPPSDIDLSAVNVSQTTGDYNPQKLKVAVRKSHVIGDVVKHYLKIAPGKLGVTFATDVETATDIAAQFNAAGVPAAVVSAKTPDAERIALLRRFKNRELLQLVNVDLFGEGFDLPAIEVVSMARPTQSYALFVQQFGRALRLLDGKAYAIIIDHVGNVERHGLPDARREWTLDRREKRSKSTKSDSIPVKTCLNETCLAVYERIYSACPFCGHVTPPAARNAPEFVDGDLCELDPATLAQMRGEIDRVDMDKELYREELAAKHTPKIGQLAHVKRHAERQEAQAALRHSIAWWAGYQRAMGRNDSESYRRFYFAFGVDVMTAQALNTKEAIELAGQINEHLGGLANA